LKVHVNVPLVEVVCELHVWVPGVPPLKVNVPIDVLGVYPDPVTVTNVPEGPEVRLKDIAGVVMMNWAEAESGLPSLPVATTLYVADASEGTVKMQANVPVTDVV
jgi:hypothetical protein